MRKTTATPFQRHFTVLACALIAYLVTRTYRLGGIYCHVDDCGVLRDFFLVGGDTVSTVKQLFTVWTYAPGKFFFLIPLARALGPMPDPDALLWLGRMSSVVVGLAGLAAFGSLLWRAAGEKFTPSTVATLALAVFSVKELANAQQSFHYSFAPLLCVVSIAWLWRLLDEKRPDARTGLAFGLSLGFLTWFHYQGTLLFCGVVVASLALRRGDVVRTLSAAAISYAACFAPLYEFTFAAIKHHRVAFWTQDYVPRSYAALDLVSFYARNLWAVLSSNWRVGPDYWMPLDWVGAACLTLVTIGVLRTTRAKKVPPYAIATGLLTAILLGAWCGMTFFKQMQLSPTRHSLILAPLGWLLVFFSLESLPKKARSIAAVGLAVAVTIAGLIGFQRYTDDRQDKIRPELTKLIEANHPSAIITSEWTETPLLVLKSPPAASLQPRFETNAMSLLETRGLESVLYISHRAPPATWLVQTMISKGFEVSETLREETSPASQEPVGGMNGRNGIYVTLFTHSSAVKKLFR